MQIEFPLSVWWIESMQGGQLHHLYGYEHPKNIHYTPPLTTTRAVGIFISIYKGDWEHSVEKCN